LKKKKKKGKKKSETERSEDKGLCSVMELRRRALLEREQKKNEKRMKKVYVKNERVKKKE
jgi:hypothetical protein